MVPYIIRRLLWMVPTLLAMALITFTIMHLTPGSPLDPVADNAHPLSPEAQRNMAKQYGLDKPLWQQFVIFLARLYVGILAVRTCIRTGLCTRLSARPFRCRCTWGGWHSPWRSWGA